MTAAEELLTPAQLSDEVRKSVPALAQWRYLGTGPRYVKLGRVVRYRRSDVDAWIEAGLRTSTGGA